MNRHTDIFKDELGLVEAAPAKIHVDMCHVELTDKTSASLHFARALMGVGLSMHTQVSYHEEARQFNIAFRLYL